MDSDLDEVDEFHAGKEQVLLDQTGSYGRAQYDSSLLDEEVMSIDENDLDDDQEDNQEEEEEEDVNEDEQDVEIDEDQTSNETGKGWGGRKNYYGGEDDQEEDTQMMSEEAMRQQKKHLEELAMDDFVDEETMEQWQKSTISEPSETVEAIDVLLAPQMSSKDRLELLSQQFPEFVPLLKELGSLRPQLEEFGQDPVGQVKHAALLGYLGAVTLYFAFVFEGLREGLGSMKESPVMETILAAREVWRQASELRTVKDADSVVQDGDDLEIDEVVEENVYNEQDIDQEEEEEESEVSGSDLEGLKEPDGSKSASKTLEFPDINAKRARTTKKGTKTLQSDYSESAAPDSVDMEDKQRRRKTLRFYTSKIDQAAQKHAKFHGGDTDLPYRERLFERQQRLIEEARKRGLEEKDELGVSDGEGADEGEGSTTRARGSKVDGSNELAFEDYYSSIKEAREDKRAGRKQAHDMAVQIAKEGKLAEGQELVGEEGKRALNFQILKNKGLTPKRNKDNRNLRVKKKKKYAKAQTKLKSVRQVYTEPKGPYEGEKTGIKKGLTRSVKLV